MPNRLGIAILLTFVGMASAAAQQPVPSITPEPLGPPSAPAPALPLAPPSVSAPAPQPPAVAPAPAGRIFCEQSVTYRLADPDTVPPTYRPFVGIWSDADWTPSLCAALIVETVQGDGSATITYAYGPLGPNQRTPGGVLHGTGVVRDGQLLFQNNDGSQFAFKPFYADLQGQYTTPQGQTHQALFKKTY
jgi:hypothetical protein